LKGQLRDLRIVSNTGDEKTADLAIQALKEGPVWICATQNHYKVLCYQKKTVWLSR
jgi:hypothetical protein